MEHKCLFPEQDQFDNSDNARKKKFFLQLMSSLTVLIRLKEIHAQKCKQKHNYSQFKFKSNRALLHSWIGFNFLVLPTITAPPTWPSSSPSFPSITITTSSYNNNNIELFHISELLYKVLTSCKAGMISCKISSKLNFNLRCSPIFRSI